MHIKASSKVLPNYWSLAYVVISIGWYFYNISGISNKLCPYLPRTKRLQSKIRDCNKDSHIFPKPNDLSIHFITSNIICICNEVTIHEEKPQSDKIVFWDVTESESNMRIHVCVCKCGSIPTSEVKCIASVMDWAVWRWKRIGQGVWGLLLRLIGRAVCRRARHSLTR